MDKLETISGRGNEGSAGEAPLRPGSPRATSMVIGFCALLGGLLPFVFQPESVSRYVAETQARVQTVDDAAVTNAIAGLKSKQSLDNLIHSLDLTHDDNFAPHSPGFVQVVSDIVSGGGMTIAQGEAQIRDRLAEAIAVTYDRGSRLVRVSVTAGEAGKANKLADTLSGMFSDGLTYAAGRTDPALEGLRQALERAEAALSGFLSHMDEKRVIELRQFRSDKETLAAQIAQAEADLAALSRKATQASSMTEDDVFARPLPDNVEFTGLEYQRQRQVQAKLTVDQLSANLGPRHPRLLAAQAALDEVRKDMQQAIRQLVSSLQREQAEAVKQLAEMKARRDGMAADKDKADGAERLASLETAVDEARNNYLQGQQNGAVTPAKPAAPAVQFVKPAVVRRADTAATIPWLWCAAGAGLGFAAASAVVVSFRRRRDAFAEEQHVAETEADLDWMQDVDLLADDINTGEEPEPVRQHWPERAHSAAIEPIVSDTWPLVAANDRSLVDQINDVLMANRRPVAEVKLPPLVAAVMAGGLGSVETKRPAAASPVEDDPKDEQDIVALRREMSELRDKLRFYSERRFTGRG
ncbi:hypothetical protein EPK99_15355 [Neorhizobium lilium]|uniref:Succinoglycan biosynthesis transport protein n=1 Tax=Neorhizobium lilium TaxID=2503024 RepID=A0A3S3S549_9HYPH|nr:hypothetical protein [Neorhizobium lilium]RWX77037.1 hypothetical protein EPK99_15355 [Neorhizobium lilium]